MERVTLSYAEYLLKSIMHCVCTAYIQEIGRAGRDGQPAETTMYYNNDDLGRRTTSPEIKAYCLLSSCRRKFLCEHFGTQFISCSPHSCCDNCHQSCCCEFCSMTSSVSSEFLADDSNEFHDCSTEDIIQYALLQYFSAVNTSMQTDSSLDAVLQTGQHIHLLKILQLITSFFSTRNCCMRCTVTLQQNTLKLFIK